MFDRPVLVRHSYDPSDVVPLLTPLSIKPMEVAEKERLIQTGKAHYSEMISDERRPDQRYMDIFDDALARHETRIAEDIARIAKGIAEQIAQGLIKSTINLCSLVRAGLPYGVLLRRALASLGIDVAHYGVSIIRDRGLDRAAMAQVLRERPHGDVLFVDGWTGKGAISKELSKAWRAISGRDARLVVLADPAGHAWLAGSHEDWLIPSGILGANVSGLISRSILRQDLLGPGDFHGVMTVDHLSDIDRSRDFVDRISVHLPGALALGKRLRPPSPGICAQLRMRAAKCVDEIAYRNNVDNLNRIKPGIAEATRAVLRRRPQKVFLRDLADPDLAALVHLCTLDGIDVEIGARFLGPYRAITLIKRVM